MDDANMDLAIDGVLWGAFRKRVPNDHREGPGWGMMLHPAGDSVIRFPASADNLQRGDGLGPGAIRGCF